MQNLIFCLKTTLHQLLKHSTQFLTDSWLMLYNENMEFIKLEMTDLHKVVQLYDEIKSQTFTVWDKDYPSVELIKYDIERQGLHALISKNNEIIAISYVGQRNEDDESNYPWKQSFKKRATFARFGVNPKFQHKGFGFKMINHMINYLKKQGFDGLRITVEPENLNAIKLYEKLPFVNCGTIQKHNKKYILYEMELV